MLSFLQTAARNFGQTLGFPRVHPSSQKMHVSTTTSGKLPCHLHYVSKLSRFARIMWFRMDDQKVHFQWFDHGSTTVIEELARPDRLFLTDSCGTMDLQKIIGKVVVHERPSRPIKHGEFFYE